MIPNKKALLLLVCVFFALSNTYAFFYQVNADPNRLLEKAYKADDAKKGIALAKLALAAARRQNNKIIIVKCLSLTSEYFFDLRRYDSTRLYANNALKQADEYHLDSLKGDCLHSLGMVSFSEDKFEKAISEYKTAVASYKKSSNLSGVGTCYIAIGVSQRKLARYGDAIDTFTLAADIFQQLKDEKYLAYTFSSIAVCFNELGNFSKSLEYNKKALMLRLKSKDNELISESENNIGFLFYKHKKPDSAIYYLSSSLARIKNDSDSSGLVLTLQNLGASWRSKGEIQKASNYIGRAQRIAADYKMGDELARGNADLAELYLQQKKSKLALAAIDVTIKTAQKQKLSELLLRAYTITYNIYKQTGDYKNALLFDDKKDSLNDTLFTIAKNKAVGETETKYQTKQKEAAIISWQDKANLQQKILSQQTGYIIVLGIAAILLAILFVIAYNNFRKKNKANERIQILMKDLHHRVKNNLQILSGLFSMQIDNQSDENTKAALRENEARLTSMNLIHNKLYLDNTTTKIEMNDYLTKLLNHIKDSFGGIKPSEISLRIEVTNIMLEADKAVAIGLIANELATNSFKYAFNGTGTGEIHLALQLIEKSKILLTLADNGIGLKPENKDKAPSFGLKLVNLMARQLNSTLVVKSNPGVFYQMEISI